VTTDRSSTYLIALNPDIIRLRWDMDEMKSTNISMLWGDVDILEDPLSEIPTVPAASGITPATVTRDADAVDVDGESDKFETDEEELETLGGAVCEDLEDLEGDFIRVATEALLRDMSMIGSRGSKPTQEIIAKPSKVGNKKALMPRFKPLQRPKAHLRLSLIGRSLLSL